MSLNKSKALRTAEKYVLQGKLPAAIDEYRKVVVADPSDLTTINTLGDLYVRAGKIQDAIANFSRIADSYRESGFTLKAIAMLKKISKLDPTNVETSMKLANLYSQQGLLVEARQQYLQVADAFARSGQTRKALDAYQKIADLDPSNTSVRMKLGEIYSREGMAEQAHDAFIMSGAEFLRKGDIEQALNANLKAIALNAESRQGLTAIATIYTQQGQADRAINLLCDAFEKNPGDVELLTILGRTYLSAGLMDDAERTFLSLVELDRNRYHYLLEVGRRFLQIGDLDRAAEQIDGCLEVLIAKREEDKAIDFLRRVLDKDMNHIGSLKRLAQIFLRIREDHNLISTLNSLTEAAMRKGSDEEAIAALKELVRLEPDEPIHLQRLYNLGVRDIVEADEPDVVRATGPLDYESAAFDDAFVIRQISEAEILAGHGQVDHAVAMLREILNHTPDNVQIHMKLKDIYLRAGLLERAAQQCLELSRIHEARGEGARASDFAAEARQLNPGSGTEEAAEGESKDEDWKDDEKSFAFASNYDEAFGGSLLNSDSGFEMREDAGGFDLSRYQTGKLTDHAGFVTVPEDTQPRKQYDSPQAAPASEQGFRYSDTLVGGPREGQESDDVSKMVFNATGDLPSDTMPRVLRDELEGIDFYIAQGYVEIARDTLDRLLEENGEHPEIVARYRRLGVNVFEKSGSPAPGPVASETGEPFMGMIGESVEPELGFAVKEESVAAEAGQHVEAASPEVDGGESAADASFDQFKVEVVPEPVEDEADAQPFWIHKETGPLEGDLMVQFNTSELQKELLKQFNTSDLLNDTPFDLLRTPTGALSKPSPGPVGTGDLIASIVSDIDASFENITQEPPAPEQSEAVQPEAAKLEGGPVEFEQIKAEPVDTQEPEAGQLDADAEVVAGSLDELYELDSVPEVEEPGVADEAMDDVTSEAGEGWDASELMNLGDTLDYELSEAAEEASTEGASQEYSIAGELGEIIEELKENTGDLQPLMDYETHYSLGLAYKDMDLHDDAIEQFQMAYKMASMQELQGDYIQCCHMLGVCFNRKSMPKVAVMWFQRGLNVPNRSEDEYQALRFEIGLCYEQMNELDKAIDIFTEVYGIDVNYRQVGEKIKQLQAAKGA